MRIHFLLIFLTFFFHQIHAQTGWEAWEEIYNDSATSVEVQFRLSDNSCDAGGKKYKFRTRVKGQLKSYAFFVNWKMEYTDCNGLQYYQQNSVPVWQEGGGVASEIPNESIDDIFTAMSLDKMYYDVDGEFTQRSGSGTLGIFKSVEAKAILGKNRISYGESVLLSVSGGVLGEGAEWVWYEDSCGGEPLGKGLSFKFQPDETTTYFVRAEGRDNVTICRQLTVQVNANSREPSGVSIKFPPCKGTPNTLKVTGGHLGFGASWKWYEDSCNGNFIGIGNYITIIPTQKTRYYVRAEGKTNVTACAFIEVIPMDVSSEPTDSIRLSSSSVCEGDSVTLSMSDKGLSADAKWVWSRDFCGDVAIGSGPQITINLDSTALIFVRAEGQCKVTQCVQCTVTVNQKSVAPEKILTVPDSGKILKRKNTTLSLQGGYLGKNAEWRWYKGSYPKGKFIGKGETLTIRPRKKANYYVLAKGDCNKTIPSSVLINPVKHHYFRKQYTPKLGYAYHFGLGVGIENTEFFQAMPFTKRDSTGKLLQRDTLTNFVNASGYRFDLVLHPVMNKYLSFGLYGGFAKGTTTLFLFGNKTEDVLSETEINYIYKRINYGAELALGLKRIKILGIYQTSSQSNAYTKTITSDNFVRMYTYEGAFKREMLSLGFRFGAYFTKDPSKMPGTFDVVYNLSRTLPGKFPALAFKDYKDLSKWNVGLGLNYWVQSRVRLRIDLMSNTLKKDLHTIDLNNLNYLASIAVNMDRFNKIKFKK